MTTLPSLKVEKELAQREKRIEVKRRAIKEVVEEYAVIRDKKLYKATHATWEIYLESRWHMSARHLNRLIAAAKVVKRLPSGNGTIGPKIPESHTRVLGKIDPEKRGEALDRAKEKAGERGESVTADDVKESVQEIAGTPVTEIHTKPDPEMVRLIQAAIDKLAQAIPLATHHRSTQGTLHTVSNKLKSMLTELTSAA